MSANPEFFNMTTSPELLNNAKTIQHHIDMLNHGMEILISELRRLQSSIPFTAPELCDAVDEEVNRYKTAIEAQEKRIDTLNKISKNEPVTQDEIDHLIKQPQLSAFANYGNIQNSSQLTF